MIFKPYFGDYEIFNLFRISGPGLGNLLFPLSRSYMYSLKYKGELLPPIWPSIKIGSFLRGEKEKRGYVNMFKPSFVERGTKQLNNIFNTKISECDFLDLELQIKSKTKQTVLVKGLRNYFDDLRGYEERLLTYFVAISSNNIRNLYDNFGSNNIGVHVRLGDYNKESRTELSWYINTIKKTKVHNSFKNAKFYIFSDGTDDELSEILSLPNCHRIPNANAWADILRLSKCQIIIGSNSTFSAWAAFLGQKPFIRHDKFYLKRIHVDNGVYEGDSVEEFLLTYQN